MGVNEHTLFLGTPKLKLDKHRKTVLLANNVKRHSKQYNQRQSKQYLHETFLKYLMPNHLLKV